MSSQPIICCSQGILGNVPIVLHPHLSQARLICNQLPYFLITATSFSLVCFQMFPVHQPQPSPPQSARHFMPLLTSTMDKLTSEPPCPEGRTNRSHLYDCSSTSSASQVSLSLSSIHPSVFRSSAKDVSAMTRANEVLLVLHCRSELRVSLVLQMKLTLFCTFFQKSHASDAAVQVSEPLLSGTVLGQDYSK